MSSNTSWKAAYVLHPEVAEERESWVMDRTTAVLEGRAQDVAVGLRRAATRKQLGQSERKPVDKAADYIDNNQKRLQYDQALAYGLPIATGVIEGACRYLVKDRMDIAGARWGLERAEAILKLRSRRLVATWPSTWRFISNRRMNAITPDRRSLWPSARRLEMDGMPAPQRDRKTDLNFRIVGCPASFQKSCTQFHLKEFLKKFTGQ